MIEIKHRKDLARLRRLALGSQGLLQTQPYGRGLAGAVNAINHIGYVQIDTISVIERAHHHVLHCRVPQFEPSMTNQMLLDKKIFEYWTHAASFIPINDFRFSLPYKHAIKNGQTHWYKNPDKKLMNELLARIRSDGPLRSRDIKNISSKRAGWWDWKPAKRALEQLYMEGELMISSREGFQKTYDLTERVLPNHINTQMPNIEELATHIITQQLRSHGLISLKGLTYQRRNTELRNTVKSLINEGLEQRSLEQIKLNNSDIFILEAGAFERSLPRQNNRLLIISPFDNSVIQRERLKTLFHFDYQLECYLPATKRQYGYFCLPLLFRDEFVGRMDCKTHRKNSHLEIKSLYLEKNDLEEDKVISAFIDAITLFADFQKCQSISLNSAYPKRLTQYLQKKLKALG
ncbi:winged helix-turn-helix domain-containing protein [Aliikangiella sp. IMCC44359]|uniref:winged helix-turn-helix domain-containing protein n=1 Tax=Aliikangiella sp. IMCC44359 TaxID=3459125 RepID=UPI00403AC56C